MQIATRIAVGVGGSGMIFQMAFFICALQLPDMMITRVHFLPVVLFATGSLLGGDEYMGAEELLGKIASELDAGKTGEDPAKKVRADLRDIIAKADADSEKEAAAAWVSLVADYLAIPEGKRSSLANENPPFRLSTLVEGLPRPEAWDEIRAAIAGLPADSDPMFRQSLLLIEATLSGDMERQLQAMVPLKESYLAKKKGDSWSERYAKEYFDNAEREIQETAGGDTVASFRMALDVAEAKKDGDDDYGSSLGIPALAGTVGEEEAEALIIRALKTGQIYGIDGDPTKRLVAKVMMANPDSITKPVWEVVETPAEIPLFEMMEAKFMGDDDWAFARAEGDYIRSLLELGEYGKAHARITRRAKEGTMVEINLNEKIFAGDKERVAEMSGFFTKLLKEDPTYPYWDIHGALAEKAGMTGASLLAMKVAMGSAEEGTEQLETFRSLIISGLLSEGRVEEAVAFLRDIVRKMSADGAISNDGHARNLLNHSLRLVRMARLLGKPDLVEEGFAAAEKAVVLNRSFTDMGSSTTLQLVWDLVDQGRGAKAEELLAGELVFMSRLTGNSRQPRSNVMTALAYVYSKAGRHADVVALLENGTMWDADDLVDLRQSRFQQTPLMLIAAGSLHAEGRNDIALQLLDRVIETESGNDEAYALLVAIGGEGIIGKFDGIHAKNRFEERPLIWKAKALSDAGKLDEAEAVAKAAIAIDPSDGEQGKGDRMRVYAVLAEIMAKKGDKEQSDFLKRVVKAIRLSETGDDWWQAGMQKRAISIYEDSLKEFADAYCIQSRLALRYSEMGDFEKAAEHYRRAFELMPESFGRVESHCFGCEGAFDGDVAQEIAEAVFLELAEKMPDRAQVFYLLGYLREQQGRKKDAAEHFAKAVEIDPDYINAWSKLGNVADDAGLPVEEKDRIHLELFRLNPYGSSLAEVMDLSKLWSAALEADKTFAPDENAPVFPLKSSQRIPGSNSSYHYNYYDRKTAPRTQLASHERMSQTLQLLESIWRN